MALEVVLLEHGRHRDVEPGVEVGEAAQQWRRREVDGQLEAVVAHQPEAARREDPRVQSSSLVIEPSLPK